MSWKIKGRVSSERGGIDDKISKEEEDEPREADAMGHKNGTNT